MTDAFLENRSVLFGLAYRMLGSVADAEDAVQDVYVRWQKAAAEDMTIRSPKAWLIATTTRLCIDRLRSARRQREEYFGVWLPEPLVESAAAEPLQPALADSLSTAFLLLLETLTPDERAIFLLHEVFDYDHGEIAEIVGKSEANCRQIIRRAKEHLAQRRERQAADPAHAEALVQRFLAAAREGELSDFLSVLTTDSKLFTDGGGHVRAAPAPINGVDRIARFLLSIRANIPQGTRYRSARVNGALGVVAELDEKPIAVVTFTFDGDRIAEIFSVSNPEKLERVARAR
jgi:RNA polymerase sigma-70 factor (ECF subfamily)